ncbi:MAG: hypothetical protein OCD01_09965 [Fibrobacterales bacterium]
MTSKNKNNKTTTTNTTTESPVATMSQSYGAIYNEDYELIKNTVMTKYHVAPVPNDIYLQEVEGYYEVLMRNLELFKGEGFKDPIAELFYRRIASARFTQANMNINHNSGEDTGPTWAELYAEAKALRKRLLSRIKFICDEDPVKKAIVSKISGGNRISDTIQDLFDLGRIGKEMIPELAEMMVTEVELEKALELGSTLGRRHKSSSMDGNVFSETRILRDKALTLMYVSLKLVRKWARLVYEEDKQSRDLFYSKYLRQKNKKTKADNAEGDLSLEEIEELIDFEEEGREADFEKESGLDEEASDVA